MMYRVMVTFDPMQCVATPLDSQTQQPRPSYERSWLPVMTMTMIKILIMMIMIKVTDDSGATDDGSLPTRGIYTVLITYKTKCFAAPTNLSENFALMLSDQQTLR